MDQQTDIHTTEGGGAHHYENANVTVSDGNAWYESKTYKSAMATFRISLFIVAIGSVVFGAYLYQRDVNAKSAGNAETIERELQAYKELADQRQQVTDARIKHVEDTTITTAQFRAEFDALNQRLARIEAAIDRVNGRPYAAP